MLLQLNTDITGWFHSERHKTWASQYCSHQTQTDLDQVLVLPACYSRQWAGPNFPMIRQRVTRPSIQCSATHEPTTNYWWWNHCFKRTIPDISLVQFHELAAKIDEWVPNTSIVHKTHHGEGLLRSFNQLTWSLVSDVLVRWPAPNTTPSSNPPGSKAQTPNVSSI